MNDNIGKLLLGAILVLSAPGILSANEEGEEVQSLTEERREILLYGIDSQVLELIDELKEERNQVLNGEVHATLKTNRNPKIRSAIFRYFEETDYRGAEEDARSILEVFEDQDDELVLASVNYLAEDPSPDLFPVLEPLLEAGDQEIQRVALEAVGLSGAEGSAELLLDYLDDSDFPDNLKPQIILALGDTHSPIAIDPLVEILEDTGEDATWRRYACASLGKIGDPQVLPVIETVLFDDDANLRSYAVGALRYFDTEEVIPMLISGLKDSFWRVRVSAAQGLGEKKADQAVEILKFKAEKDPEMNVREAAIRALGEIGGTAVYDFLRETYKSDRTPMGLRYLSAEILSQNDLGGSLTVFTEVINSHWGKENSRVVERSAYYLSLAEQPGLETLYSKFLDSGEIVIIIYGIRGIALNGYMDLKPAVEKLSEEGNHRSIRKAALAALEQF